MKLKSQSRELLSRFYVSTLDVRIFIMPYCGFGLFQWPRGLSRMSAAALLLRLWVRIPPVAWMFIVSVVYILCGQLITRPEESYRQWCVVVCDLKSTRNIMPWLALGRSATKKLACIKAESMLQHNIHKGTA
jgi:hypothetical protein